MSHLAEESIQNGVSHENIGALSQNGVPHGYQGDTSNAARLVLFRPDTSNPDENQRVDSCIDLSTSGNQQSVRLAEQRRMEELLHYSESTAAQSALSSKHSALGGGVSTAKRVFFSQSRTLKKVGAT